MYVSVSKACDDKKDAAVLARFWDDETAHARARAYLPSLEESALDLRTMAQDNVPSVTLVSAIA